MRRTIWIRLTASAVALMAAGCGSSARAAADEKSVEYRHEASVVAHAVRQMLADYIQRDLRAFCSDFKPAVAAHLVKGEDTCELGLAPAFSPQPGQEEIYAPSERPNGLRISHVRWHGNIAHLTSTWPWPTIRESVNLTLQQTHGRWLIATPTHVVEERLCSRALGKLNCRTFYGVRFGVHVPSSVVMVEPKQP
jgi:hypothetical protein